MHNTKRLSTIEYIYEKLKQSITEYEFEPDEHLVETTLAKTYEVSRTPLRQALFRLELEGLVVKKPTGRIHVAPMSNQEARELFQIRELLEGLIAREATKHISKSDDFHDIITKMEDITFLMRKAAETGRKTDIVSYGSQFHSLLEDYSNNTTAVTMLGQINIRIARYRRLGAYRDPVYPSTKPVDEHAEILQHIKNKDELAAERAMKQHIIRSLENVLKAISYLN